MLGWRNEVEVRWWCWGEVQVELRWWTEIKIRSPHLTYPYLTWTSLPYFTITLTSSQPHYISQGSSQSHLKVIPMSLPHFNLTLTSLELNLTTSTWPLYLITLPHKTLPNLIWISTSLPHLTDSSHLHLTSTSLPKLHYLMTLQWRRRQSATIIMWCLIE